MLKLTPVAKILFSFGEICCSAGSKQTFLKMGTLSLDAKAYPPRNKNKQYEIKKCRHIAAIVLLSVTMEILLFPFLFGRKFSRALHACALILPLCLCSKLP